MDHADWLDSLEYAGGRKELARAAGINPATMYRQIERGGLKMDTVRDIARAAGKPAVVELIRTGHLSPTDLDGANTQAALKQASVTELVDELWERAHNGDGLDELNPTGDGIANIHPLPTPPDPDTINQHLADQAYAADQSPGELLPGDEGYHDGP